MDVGLLFFSVFVDLYLVPVHQTVKKLWLGQYPGHLASRLVNNAYRYISHVDLEQVS